MRDHSFVGGVRTLRNINRSARQLAHVAQDFAQRGILSRDFQQPALERNFRGCRWDLIHRHLTQRTARHLREHDWRWGLMGIVVWGRSRRGVWGSSWITRGLSKKGRSCQQEAQSHASTYILHQNFPIFASGPERPCALINFTTAYRTSDDPILAQR